MGCGTPNGWGLRGSLTSMGTRRERLRRVHTRIKNICEGRIRGEEGTSSSPHSHSPNSTFHIALTSLQIQVSEDSMNSLQQKNIDDILEERKWEVRNAGN